MYKKKIRMIWCAVLLGIILFIVPVASTGQEPPNPLSAPQISESVDRDWRIFNVVKIGEKSCITIDTLSTYISRCFESPDMKISDTVPLPHGNLSADMYVTRVSLSNGDECLITTSSMNDFNGSISCSSDVHLTH